MKTLLLIILLIFCGFQQQCRSGHTVENTDLSFTVEESDEQYRVFVNYNPANTQKVESVLDKYLKQSDDPSFANTQLDATMILGSKTIFYIKHGSGELTIKMDKSKNSQQALQNFKQMAEEIKGTL